MTIHLGPLQALPFDELQILIDREMCSRSLVEFVRRAWHVLEPATKLVWEWPLDAICEHLEAISRGQINRLLANVPPGSMKSLLVSVFWQAWEWGPLNRPHLRFLGVAHNMPLAIRDATKLRRLLTSDWYQARWGDRFALTSDVNAKRKFENTATGFRAAVASGGVTGERVDRVIVDDPHSVEGAKSDAERASVVENFFEAIQNRLTDQERGAIVVIMQRLHEQDVSGEIISRKLPYTHLMLPMRFEPARRCKTSIGFVDPRQEDGELLFPKRMSEKKLAKLEAALASPYAVAGQYQQRPEPRGGGILRRSWWQPWNDAAAKALEYETARTFPAFDYVVASIDTAYTMKEENDPSAMTVWGVFRDKRSRPRAMLVHAWTERLELNALVLKVAEICKRYRVDDLLIESKASGISVDQEIRRLNADARWRTVLIDPGKLDKVARAYAVQGLFEKGMIWSPDTRWADLVKSQCASFPKGAHDDLVDTVTQAVNYLRSRSFLKTDEEIELELEAMQEHRSQRVVPLYPA